MSNSKHRTALLAAAVSATLFAVSGAPTPALAQSTGRRVIGIDVSDWQNQNGPTGDTPIDWATVHAPTAAGGGGKDFAFIRSSRGGTTGTYNEQAGTGTLSHRYDDFAFVYNITQATANGMFAGAYHFGRPDILTNTGADEADHMIQQAGNWMRPGYMLPTFDFEAGDARSTADLSQFANDFANRIRQVKGITPLVYINQNYALNEINSTVPAAMPNNWVARWPDQIYWDAVDTQNGNPIPSPVTQNVYGLWNTSFPQVATPEPWKFWQYNSRGRVPGIGAGAVAVDLDVAHGDMEYLKDFLVPALWMTDASGDWSTLSQWNSDNPGYVAGNDATGPAPRLPNNIDTVILDRGAANPTITLSSGAHAVRKLLVRENLNITGGSLNVGYVPYTPAGGNMGSGPISAQFSSDVTLSGSGALSVHTLQVDATRTFDLNGGSLTFNTINLTTDSTTPAKILVGGDVNIAGLNGRTATIGSVGLLTPGTINLAGGTRTLTVADGAAETDLIVNVGVTNGTLVKAGPGTMRLNTPISTFLTINDGTVVASFAGLPSITNNGTMVFDLPGASAYGATIGGSGALIKHGAGSLDIGGTQTLTGPVTINDSTVRLNQTTGRLASAGSYTINNGALTLDNGSGNQPNRLSSGGAIALNAGTINFIGAFTSEVAGPLGAVSGASTIALSESGGSSSSLSFASLARSPGATINFSSVGSGATARIASGATPGAFLGQGVFVNGGDYAITDGVGNVVAMPTGPGADEYATTFTPGRHVKRIAATSNVPTTSIKTLNFAGVSGSTALAINATLTLTDGGIIYSSPSGMTIDGAGTANVAAPSGVEFVINTATAGGMLGINVQLTGGSGLTKTGPGTLSLYATSNSYNGTTSVLDGTLLVQSTNLGPGNLYLSGGAKLQVMGDVVNGRAVTLGSGGGGIDSQGTWHGAISGPGGLTKTGGGTLVLNSAANTYSGPTVINGGVLVAGQSNFGDGSASNTLSFQNGNALVALGAIDMKRALTFGGSLGGEFWPNGYTSTFSGAITGTGNLVVTGPGTLVLNGGANTHSGATHVANGATLVAGPNDLGDGSAGNVLRLLGGGRLRIADNLTMSRAIEVNFGSGTFDTDGYAATFSGTIDGGGTFTKSGFGPLTLTGPSSVAFSGQVVVNNGTLRLAGANSALFGPAGYTINGGGALKLDNHSSAGGNRNDRLTDSAPITMNGGTLWLYGGPTTELAGNLTLASGYNNLILNGSTTTTLAMGALARNAGATLNFLNASSTLKTTFTGGVTPGAFVGQGVFVGSNYAVYDAAGFVRAMAAGAGDSDFDTAVTANRHVKLSGTNAGIATTSIYTLNIAGSATATTQTLAAGATLTLAKGGILSVGTGGNTITGGTAITTAPTTELVIHTPDTGDLLTISTPITGGSGLTKSGLGRVSLNSTANAYAGATIIAGGTLRLSISNVIPDASNVTIGPGAQLDLATRAETVGGTLTMHSGARVFSHTSNSIVSGGTLTLAGANPTINYVAGGEAASIEGAAFALGTATGVATFNVADGDADVDLNVTANVQNGSGAVNGLTKTGAGTLRLAGILNDFTGPLTLNAGTIEMAGLIAGSGTFQINPGGTLTGSGNSTRPVTLAGGVINLSPGGTIANNSTVSAGGTWKGQGGANGVVNVTGGTFTIGAGASFTGTTVDVTGGTFVAAHANSTINASLIYRSTTPGTWGGTISGATKGLQVLNNASLTLTGTNTYGGGTQVTAGVLAVTGDGQLGSNTVITGSAGTLRLAGNVSYALPLSIGGAGVNGSLNAAPGSLGALDNLAGVNTWSGPITLSGIGNNGGDAQLNQIGSSAGTLILSGVISGGGGNSWAKTGAGDVLLTGAAPNTYSNLTRVFGGRLIIEKDGALGAAGATANGTGHTFELAGSASTIAFRAPASSPGGFTYSTFEVLNTEGTGASGGFGQVDNLGGDNTFAGQIALAGPTSGGGAMQSSIGVSAGSLHVTGGLYARAAGATPREITKVGPGRLILSADSSVVPANTLVVPLANSTMNVAAGAVELRSPSATQANLPGVTTWNVNSGASVHLAAGLLSTRTLNVSGNVTVAPGGAKFVRAQQFAVAGSGKLDLADNGMIVDYSGANPIGTFDGTAYTGLTRLIADNYNFGGWDSTASGITSSTAAAGGGLTTIAITDAETALGIFATDTAVWNGQVVDGSSVLLMYTYAGDVNLDGMVDAADYGIIDNYYQFAGTSGYANGDFNYDGIIDAGDYGLIDNAFQLQGPPLGGAAPALASVTAVPEPSACVIASVGVASLAMRRRRRRT